MQNDRAKFKNGWARALPMLLRGMSLFSSLRGAEPRSNLGAPVLDEIATLRIRSTRNDSVIGQSLKMNLRVAFIDLRWM